VQKFYTRYLIVVANITHKNVTEITLPEIERKIMYLSAFLSTQVQEHKKMRNYVVKVWENSEKSPRLIQSGLRVNFISFVTAKR